MPGSPCLQSSSFPCLYQVRRGFCIQRCNSLQLFNIPIRLVAFPVEAELVTHLTFHMQLCVQEAEHLYSVRAKLIHTVCANESTMVEQVLTAYCRSQCRSYLKACLSLCALFSRLPPFPHKACASRDESDHHEWYCDPKIALEGLVIKHHTRVKLQHICAHQSLRWSVRFDLRLSPLGCWDLRKQKCPVRILE
jgi:hypothetical protein